MGLILGSSSGCWGYWVRSLHPVNSSLYLFWGLIVPSLQLLESIEQVVPSRRSANPCWRCYCEVGWGWCGVEYQASLRSQCQMTCCVPGVPLAWWEFFRKFCWWVAPEWQRSGQ